LLTWQLTPLSTGVDEAAIVGQAQSALRIKEYFPWVHIVAGIIQEHGCSCLFAGIDEEEKLETAQINLDEVQQKLRNHDYEEVQVLPQNWEKLPNYTLKEYCRQRGLLVSGKKKDYIARLQNPSDPDHMSRESEVITKDRLNDR